MRPGTEAGLLAAAWGVPSAAGFLAGVPGWIGPAVGTALFGLVGYLWRRTQRMSDREIAEIKRNVESLRQSRHDHANRLTHLTTSVSLLHCRRTTDLCPMPAPLAPEEPPCDES